jgi:hypothetical protein
VTDLRQEARGEQCTIRVPGICCGDPAKVVLCHVRIIGISGIGMKSPDALAAYGCHPCHDLVDGRTKTNYTLADRRLFLLEGMARTQHKLIQRGILRW